MVKCKDGPYVCHEQHAEIVAALAADKQAAEANRNLVKQLKDRIERLTIAGDALSYALQTGKDSTEEINHYADAWTAAKGMTP
jgi:hypothetical protein